MGFQHDDVDLYACICVEAAQNAIQKTSMAAHGMQTKTCSNDKTYLCDVVIWQAPKEELELFKSLFLSHRRLSNGLARCCGTTEVAPSNGNNNILRNDV